TDPPHLARAQVRVGSAEATIFHPLRWLRENGHYLRAGAGADRLYIAAFYLRSLLGVHYALGLLLLGVALALYVTRLLLHGLGLAAGGTLAARLDGLDWDLYIHAATLQGWVSPLLWLAPAIALLGGGPLALAYWLVFRQERSETATAQERAIRLAPYWLLLASAVFAVLLARFDNLGNPLLLVLVYGVYLALAALVLRRLWLAPLAQQGGEDWTHSGGVARVRLALTQKLTRVLAAALIAAAAGVVDSFGQTLFVLYLRNRPAELWAAGAAGVALMLALALGYRLAMTLPAGEASAWRRAATRAGGWLATAIASTMLVMLAALAVALVQWATFSPWLFELRMKAQAVLRPGHFALLLGVGLAWLLLAALLREAPTFLNNATFHRFYCARLVRTFLGAANFRRLRALQQALQGPLAGGAARRLFVQEAHADDDLALRAYYGNPSAAPLHLIGATVNESRTQTSNLVRFDRKGVAFAIGPAGINVDAQFFPWAQPAREIGMRLGADGSSVGEEAQTQRTCERLPLGAWAAISGAAVSTGRGALSSFGSAALAWLVNARLGYWWQPADCMRLQPRDSTLKTFDYLWQELSGGFYGRRDALWHLTDGGHFDNTGIYELLRRRSALIVCADCGFDPAYRCDDLQNLVRRARLDFGAEIEFLDEASLQQVLSQAGVASPHGLRLFGTLAQLREAAGRGDRCALLARVRYAPEAGDRARGALLVVIKPVLTPFAPADVAGYAAAHPAFPQQPTSDQSFDEAQWESYRRLGQDIGRQLFALWPCLVSIARRWATAD
ncbi:MAG: hypothetical protein N2483_08640, partial [Burkholderiaceae bacterium]|nr:hypothetical protein [Burkholderiaceae bacterium]